MTGIHRIPSTQTGVDASTAVGIFAKRHRDIFLSFAPTSAPTLLPTSSPSPAGPEFIDAFHCVCKDGFVAEPGNRTHCKAQSLVEEEEDAQTAAGPPER